MGELEREGERARLCGAGSSAHSPLKYTHADLRAFSDRPDCFTGQPKFQ